VKCAVSNSFSRTSANIMPAKAFKIFASDKLPVNKIAIITNMPTNSITAVMQKDEVMQSDFMELNLLSENTFLNNRKFMKFI
jgi:hypothetical protein